MGFSGRFQIDANAVYQDIAIPRRTPICASSEPFRCFCPLRILYFALTGSNVPLRKTLIVCVMS